MKLYLETGMASCLSSIHCWRQQTHLLQSAVLPQPYLLTGSPALADPSNIVNEMIYSIRKAGRMALIGDYMVRTRHANHAQLCWMVVFVTQRQSAASGEAASGWSAAVRCSQHCQVQTIAARCIAGFHQSFQHWGHDGKGETFDSS